MADQNHPDYQRHLTLQGPPSGIAPEYQENGDLTEAQVVAGGLGMAQRYMAGNAPFRPVHKYPAETMTKAELTAQKEREMEGLPPQPEAADRVLKLEDQVTQINQSIGALAQMMQNLMGPSEEDAPSSPGPGTTEKDPPPRNKPSNESLSPSEVTAPARIGLGSEWEGTLAEEAASPTEDWDFEEAPPEVQHDPREERIQTLAQQTRAYFAGHDAHRTFRRFIAGLHRQLGYEGWPPAIRADFDEKFRTALEDPKFLVNICSKVADMDGGHAIVDQTVFKLMVACAGFYSFTMAGL